MFVTQINIRREGYYGSHYVTPNADKPFSATIEVHGKSGKLELLLDAEMSQRIVAIIADEIAAAGRATAEAMTAEIRSEEHTSELQSLMRISYAVFCLKKKKQT